MANGLATAEAWFVRVQNNKLFEVFVITVILLSAVLVGIRTYPVEESYLPLLNTLDYLVTVFFLVEILIRMAGERGLRAFFSKGWNVFDFTVVAVSLIPLSWAGTVLVARLLRVFRVLRLVSFIPELRVLVNALVKSLPRLFYVAVMMFVIFYIYGAVGSLMFGAINEKLWGNIGVAMLTLFRIATFEDWTDIMYETMAVYPASWLFYVTFIFLAAFVFLNMVIGIILDIMQREHERFDREAAAETFQAGPEAPTATPSDQWADLATRLDRIERLLSERSLGR